MKRSKLSFKGDSQKKVKKSSTKKAVEEVEEIEEDSPGWINVMTKEDLQGPLIISPCDDANKCISFSENGKISLKKLVGEEPTTIDDVLVGQYIQSTIFGLKNAHGKYLGSDKFGGIIATREAISQQEEWTPIIREDGIGFMHSTYNKFLCCNENELRVDSTSMGFHETFIVKFQGNRKKKEIKKKEAEKDLANFEENQIKKFLGWGEDKIKAKLATKEEMAKAKEEGRLHEELLERRIKMKSDKFCY